MRKYGHRSIDAAHRDLLNDTERTVRDAVVFDLFRHNGEVFGRIRLNYGAPAVTITFSYGRAKTAAAGSDGWSRWVTSRELSSEDSAELAEALADYITEEA